MQEDSKKTVDEEEISEETVDEKVSEETEEKIEEETENENQVSEEKKDDVDENDDYNNLMNQFMRLQADFTNYKKRVEKEKEGYVTLGVRKIVNDLLPVLDNLERALKSIEEHYSDDEIFNGINMIDDQFLEILNKNGIKEIKAEGEKFDPKYHHAVAIVESDEYDDVVVDVLQKGYEIDDVAIRPAMVRVYKKTN